MTFIDVLLPARIVRESQKQAIDVRLRSILLAKVRQRHRQRLASNSVKRANQEGAGRAIADSGPYQQLEVAAQPAPILLIGALVWLVMAGAL